MPPRPNPLVLALCLWCGAVLIYAVAPQLVLQEGRFWDLAVYQSAADLAATGAPVYGVPLPQLFFVYPPWVLWLFGAIGAWLTPLFLAAYAATLALAASLAPPSLRWGVLFFLCALGFAQDPMILALRTGNFSVYANLIVLLLWRFSDRLGPGPLLAAIVVFAAIKPQAVAFLALWLFSGDLRAEGFLRGVLALVAICAIWAAQAIWAPEAFAGFLQSLDTQVNFGSPGADLGRGVMALIADFTDHFGLALGLHILAWCVLAALWAAFLWRIAGQSGQRGDLRAIVQNGAFLLCLLATPRLKIYDTALIGPIALEAAVLWGMSLARPERWLLPVAGAICFCLALRFAFELGLFGEGLRGFWRNVSPVAFLAVFAVSALGVRRGRGA
jgi:hypothetical protein